ncbi:MAG: HD domain-containing protein [Leptolyngbyaceae cyanobacterium]
MVSDEETIGATLITPRFEQALVVATQLHGQQRRKVNDVPYISHLLGVAALVLEDGGTEAEAIAALLHDVVEDQGGAVARFSLLSQFGAPVVAIVDGCTAPEQPSGESWRSHKLRYLEQVQQASPSVHRVVLADKLHNGRSLLVNWDQFGSGMWRCFRGKPADILWFYQQCVERFARVKPGWMLNELSHVVTRLEWVVSQQG